MFENVGFPLTVYCSLNTLNAFFPAKQTDFEQSIRTDFRAVEVIAIDLMQMGLLTPNKKSSIPVQTVNF